MAEKQKPDEELSEEEIARRRDETVRRMFATPPKTQKGAPKRAQKNPRKRPA